MRVLHLISSGGMYGAEAVILTLSGVLNAEGSTASCLGIFAHAGQQTPALYEAATGAQVPATLLPCKGQMDLSVLQAIREEVQRVGADVVHAHGYKADIYAYLALRDRGRPALVSTCHTWYDNDFAVRVYGAADRWVLRSFDQVVAVTEEVRDRLLRAGVHPARVHLVRNGISFAAFSGVQDARRARERPPGELRVGLVGRLAPEKGVDVYVRAVAKLAERFPAVEFVVAGEGPEREALEALILEVGLHGRARLVGEQKNMVDFYASLDVLVSASRQEGLPMALLEGAASGLPIVGTRVGAVPEIVVSEETGLLVDPGEPDALAAAIADLLESPERRERFGTAGRARALEQFAAERMTADYCAIYRRALDTRPVVRAGSKKSAFG